jgi:Primase C terminal 2 (PriCT-2)/Bifunctional DNA primase/polymerase, N-terminal
MPRPASSASGTFGRHAGRLTHYGYDCIPITRPTDPVPDAGKRPAIAGWQQGCSVEQWPLHADCGLGILTERTPAIDIDVLDEPLAAKIQGAAERALGGEPPWRVGLWPKRLLPCRLDGEPFGKLKLSWRGLGDRRHEPTRPPAIEVLARGQQFVCIGMHPGTGRPYRWHRDPWLSLPQIFLPKLSYALAARFVRALAVALERSGATDVRLSGVREPAARLPWPERKPGLWRGNARSIADALEDYGNRDLHYDDWIRVGHALKAELPGDDGLALWEWWSSLSGKNAPELTRKKWATFDPHTITAGTIFYLAGHSR